MWKPFLVIAELCLRDDSSTWLTGCAPLRHTKRIRQNTFKSSKNHSLFPFLSFLITGLKKYDQCTYLNRRCLIYTQVFSQKLSRIVFIYLYFFGAAQFLFHLSWYLIGFHWFTPPWCWLGQVLCWPCRKISAGLSNRHCSGCTHMPSTPNTSGEWLCQWAGSESTCRSRGPHSRGVD